MPCAANPECAYGVHVQHIGDRQKRHTFPAISLFRSNPLLPLAPLPPRSFWSPPPPPSCVCTQGCPCFLWRLSDGRWQATLRGTLAVGLMADGAGTPRCDGGSDGSARGGDTSNGASLRHWRGHPTTALRGVGGLSSTTPHGD